MNDQSDSDKFLDLYRDRANRFPPRNQLPSDPVPVYVVIYPDVRDRSTGESVAVFRLPEAASAFARRNAGRVEPRQMPAEEYRSLQGQGKIL